MPPHFTLRDLPLAARLVLALFLVTVGCGYGSAMVQLHFQHASAGAFMPTPKDVVLRFHGDPDPLKRMSTLQRLIEAPHGEGVPFNGTGSMAPAFFTRSNDWKSATRNKPAEEVEKVRAEREGEQAALALWVKSGLDKSAYDADRLPLPVSWGDKPITADFRHDDGSVKVKSLVADRCVRCHQKDGDDANAANYPLDTYDLVKGYAKVETNPGAMSVTKLAQSTHAHLLSFAMLYMLTGLLFAFTNYPGWLKLTLGPAVLLAQVVDIACWWLARLEGVWGERFALTIMATGAVVGLGLALQIVLTLFHLFDRRGRTVLLALFVAGGAVVGVLKLQVIDPHLKAQKSASESPPVVAPKE